MLPSMISRMFGEENNTEIYDSLEDYAKGTSEDGGESVTLDINKKSVYINLKVLFELIDEEKPPNFLSLIMERKIPLNCSEDIEGVGNCKYSVKVPVM